MWLELMKDQYVLVITNRSLVGGIKIWLIFEKARNDKAEKFNLFGYSIFLECFG